eukprot:5378672-Ditylum_brightwellii.AAC.2
MKKEVIQGVINAQKLPSPTIGGEFQGATENKCGYKPLVPQKEAVAASLVPVEEAAKCMVPQTGNCFCLPTRFKAGGHSRPCAICNSSRGGEEGYTH